MKPVALLSLLACLCACSGPAPVAPGETAAQAAPRRSTDAEAAARQPASPAVPVHEPLASASTNNPESLPRMDGYGDVRLGMGVDAARKAWGGELIGDEVKPDNCGYLRPKWAKTGADFGLMFEGGKFVRYDIGTDRETAPGGAKVGTALEELRKLYAGRITEAPHHYVEGGKDVRVTDPAREDRAIVFEVDPRGRVTRWRVGQAPQVDYVEGCS